MRYDGPHDRATLDTPAIISHGADLTENYMYFQWSLEREFMYFAGKLVYF